MSNQKRKIITEYYQAMNLKNLQAMSSFLHDNIIFQCPFTKTSDKKSFIQGLSNVLPIFESLNVRACLNNEDEFMVVYDLKCAEPIDTIRIAAFIKFKNSLISYMELFYDPRALSFTA